MSKEGHPKPDSKRPWLERIAEPEKAHGSLDDAETELRELREIQAHREWVIDGLRAHIGNTEADLERALERGSGLEEHVENLERIEAKLRDHLSKLSEHIDNLESDATRREAYLAEVEAHVVNLERRVRQRPVDFDADGIFPHSRFPRLHELFQLGEKVREARPDLAKRFPADRAADFWYWLLWHGTTSYPEVEKQRYPEPDAFLRTRVVGHEMEPEQYRQSGLVNAWTLDGCLRDAGFDPLEGGRVLDFGVGCGRILEYFALYSDRCEFTGADVDAEAIDWCRGNLDFASFEALSSQPPSPFPDEHFDAIYTFSVFSHLPRDLQRAWLEELFRIAKPGASLVLTVQGQRVARGVLNGSWSGAFPDAKTLRKAMPKLEEEGFLFFPYGQLPYSSAENRRLDETLDPERYGSTFVLEPFVRSNWSDLFEVVQYRSAPDDWQDFVVLRRP